MALLQQHLVQFFHATRSGDWYANIASDITYQTFYKTLFISGGRIAEYCFKAIVGCQGGIPGLFPCMGTEAVFHCDLTVVKDNAPRTTTEVLKYPNQSIQETFFVLPAVAQNQGCTAVAKPHSATSRS